MELASEAVDSYCNRNLQKNITIGRMTIIHPNASLIAEAGPIVIGDNNIIEEQVVIINMSKDETRNETFPLTIGSNNVFEVGCEIRAKSVGDRNIFGTNCFVGPNVEIGNGCIIGSGCRITMEEKLPDQTVIAGKKCFRTSMLDKTSDPGDLQRQYDELTVMSEIFSYDEFNSYSTEFQVYAVFQAHLLLPSNFNLTQSNCGAKMDIPISYLPPIRLITCLPPDYPSQSSPEFTLSCCWLSKSKLDKLTAELQKLWEENQCEILFIWCSFLVGQSLEFLQIINCCDLIEKCADVGKRNQSYGPCKQNKLKHDYVSEISFNPEDATSSRSYKEPNWDQLNLLEREESKGNLLKQGYDKLMVNFFSKSVEQLCNYLVEYNNNRCKEEFKKTLQECNVCFSSILGEICKQFSCGHVTCKECLKRMCEVHIEHGTMELILCPQEDCGIEIPVNIIREMVSKELFDRFDRLMLNRTLDKISNMTYCPRFHCQYPIFKDSKDNFLAVCSNCSYAFCIFCKKAYHGIELCRLPFKLEDGEGNEGRESREKRELIELYRNCDLEKKLELEKRYGKKILGDLVNAALSQEWLSGYSKRCPHCYVRIQKDAGCNKMICLKCNQSFCWICLQIIKGEDPYKHFEDRKSECYKRLHNQ